MSRDFYRPRFGEPITKWVKWFAWRPVETIDRGYVWFRFVQRRRIQSHEYLTYQTRWWQYVKDRP